MKTTLKQLAQIAMLLAATVVLAACDKLEDGNAINEILPGLWGFSYETDEELDFAIEYESVTFHSDGRCSIGYGSEQLEGTYRASDAVIKIDYDFNGQQRDMMWKVLQMSPYRILTEYTFDYNQTSITATVILDRIAQSNQ